MLTPQEAHALLVALANATDLYVNGTAMIQVEKVARVIAPYVEGHDVKFKHDGEKYSLSISPRGTQPKD